MSSRITQTPVPFAVLIVLVMGCEGTPHAKYHPTDKTMVAGQTTEWAFDKDVTGKPPADSEVFGGTWEVQAEADAPSKPNALRQTTTAEDFPAIRLGSAVFSDLSARVRFKPASGKTDQAAGIIFRVQDKDNYYILRANALEDNLILFRYGSGRRTTLKEGSARVPSGEWQELRLEVEGNHFRGFLSDQLVVEASDDAYAAGGVGLWTKADSVTLFDDMRVSAK